MHIWIEHKLWFNWNLCSVHRATYETRILFFLFHNMRHATLKIICSIFIGIFYCILFSCTTWDALKYFYHHHEKWIIKCRIGKCCAAHIWAENCIARVKKESLEVILEHVNDDKHEHCHINVICKFSRLFALPHSSLKIACIFSNHMCVGVWKHYVGQSCREQISHWE